MSGPVRPLRQFVLKVHSRCDLACDHCYVYEHRDQSWRGRPMVMSAETVAWAAQRITEHAKAHGLAAVRVVLHGGEPLLAGVPRLRQTAQALHRAVAGVCALDLRIHTNGLGLNDAFLRMFEEQRITVGVSVDGYQAAHDRHRRYADGRGSYDRVTAAVGLLREGRYRPLYSGLLCTIDVANDPVAVYDALAELSPPQIDFLLPHATWEYPPHRPPDSPAAYADWLIAIYDRWAGAGQPMPVRLFDSIISTSTGGASHTEAIGLAPSDLVVVETDGTYEQVDSLKTAFDGAAFTGLDVTRHDLDQVAAHPSIRARQQGLDGLCDTCQACPVVTSCGGGLYAHRYRPGSGFANPSVYCADLLKLITHVVQDRARRAAPGPSPRPVYPVPGAEFHALSRGYGGETAIHHLAHAQRIFQRTLVAFVHEQAVATRAGGTIPGGIAPAWDLLSRVDRTHPRSVDAVLAHPYTRVWAAECLKNLRAGTGRSGPALPRRDLGHLAAIAAAAAIRGGVPARITVPVMAGAAHLPSLGRFIVADAGANGAAAIETAQGRFTVTFGASQWTVAMPVPSGAQPGADAAAPRRWQPVRVLRGPGLSISLEDTDPYRDCYAQPPAARLTNAEVARWQRQFGRAWDLITEHHGNYAPGLAAGLTTITPLSPAADHDTSATARHAFGAIGAALPSDHSTLALLLIHEFQHVKLGALLDLYDLFEQSDHRRFRVRWREDPRPLEGILQGTYAHVAVSDFWRVRRRTTAGAAAAKAAEQFAHWRDGTAEGIEILTESGSLTPLGRTFVEGMRSSVTPWLNEPVRSGQEA
jgi:uncharacterized protein